MYRCIYIIYEGDDFDEIYEVLSILKITKLKRNNILIGKYEDLNENPDFEQEYWSRTTTGVFKTGHDSIRLLNWLAYFERSFYEHDINFMI